MIQIGIVGGTGYTGAELLKLLINHPDAKIRVVTSREYTGSFVEQIHTNLRGCIDQAFVEPELKELIRCDIVFFATPHGVSQTFAPSLIDHGVKIIDLSADFRLKNNSDWELWYGTEHRCPHLLDKAVYGLPEMNRELIRSSQLISCPGCYPTGVILGLLPLLEENIIDTERLIANCVSGASGMGKNANTGNLFSEISENFKAYGLSGHRHHPEIEQILSKIAGRTVSLIFIPHIMPIIRGLYSTMYTTISQPNIDLLDLYMNRYQEEPFVRILPTNLEPEIRSVSGTNVCEIGVHQTSKNGNAVILTAEDNLNKGASGQAVQNMNIMFDLPEERGLRMKTHFN